VPTWLHEFIESIPFYFALPLVLGYLTFRLTRTILASECPDDSSLPVISGTASALRTTRIYYIRGLRNLISTVEAHLAPSAFGPRPPNERPHLPPVSFRGAFNHRSYQFCLQVALAYPLAAILMLWLITGSTEFAGLVISSEPTPLWDRVWTLIGAFVAVDLMIQGGWKTPKNVSAPRIVGAQLLRILALIAVIPLIAKSGTIETFYLAWCFMIALFVLRLHRPGVALNLAILVGLLALVSGITDPPWRTPLTITLLVAVLLVVWRTDFQRAARSFGPIYDMAQWFLALSAVLVALHYSSVLGDLAHALLLPLSILVLLPLINVVFDWISLGVTRYTASRTYHSLNAGRDGRALLWAILDTTLAVGFLLALSCALVNCMAALSSISVTPNGAPVFSSQTLLDQLNHLQMETSVWFFAMLASTLVPTLAHIAAALLGVVCLGANLVGNILHAALRIRSTTRAGHHDTIVRVWAPTAAGAFVSVFFAAFAVAITHTEKFVTGFVRLIANVVQLTLI